MISNDETGLGGVSLLAARVLGTLAIASLSYFLVEMPIRRGLVGGRLALVATPLAVLGVATAILIRDAVTSTVARVALRALRRVAAVLIAGAAVATLVLPDATATSTRRAARVRCPATDAPAPPNGPSAELQVVQPAAGERPEVAMVRYPRPDRPAGGTNPWSQWGQGLVLPDGRFLSAIGDHRGADGNSYLFAFDPATAPPDALHRRPLARGAPARGLGLRQDPRADRGRALR